MLNILNEKYSKNQIFNGLNTVSYTHLDVYKRQLITFVIVASLLPASLLIAHRVSGVVDERISVNAVSITTLLSHSPDNVSLPSRI